MRKLLFGVALGAALFSPLLVAAPAVAAPATAGAAVIDRHAAGGNPVHWGSYRTREECERQGRYLVTEHWDKWSIYGCDQTGHPLTPWDLLVLPR